MKIMKGLITAVTSTDSVAIYGVNAAALTASLLNISENAKLILLFASIVFTVVKTIDVIKGWVSKKDEKNNEGNK